MGLADKITRVVGPVIRLLDWMSPLAILAVRLWVADVFWKSGLTKIQTWDSTLMLFQYEYAVPVISPQVAAYMGTGVELGMPVLLAFGLGGRFAAGVLFVFNIIAVISYPDLNAVGVTWHQTWGMLLLVPLMFGPGKISIDHFIRKKYLPNS